MKKELILALHLCPCNKTKGYNTKPKCVHMCMHIHVYYSILYIKWRVSFTLMIFKFISIFYHLHSLIINWISNLGLLHTYLLWAGRQEEVMLYLGLREMGKDQVCIHVKLVVVFHYYRHVQWGQAKDRSASTDSFLAKL